VDPTTPAVVKHVITDTPDIKSSLLRLWSIIALFAIKSAEHKGGKTDNNGQGKRG